MLSEVESEPEPELEPALESDTVSGMASGMGPVSLVVQLAVQLAELLAALLSRDPAADLQRQACPNHHPHHRRGRPAVSLKHFLRRWREGSQTILGRYSGAASCSRMRGVVAGRGASPGGTGRVRILKHLAIFKVSILSPSYVCIYVCTGGRLTPNAPLLSILSLKFVLGAYATFAASQKTGDLVIWYLLMLQRRKVM